MLLFNHQIKQYFAIVLSLFCLSTKANNLNLTNVKTLQKDNSIALTLDACSGEVDWRILYLLKEKNIPATIFVTKKWLDKNEKAIQYLNENKQLFKIENHGRDHKEAIFQSFGAYHLPGVENEEGLKKEVEDGQEAIRKNFGYSATWYRDAGALYDEKSLFWLKKNGWKIAGYSVAGDEGATASKAKIIQIMKTVRPKDVILMHINHPHGATYEGLKESLPLLQQKGFVFSWLK